MSFAVATGLAGLENFAVAFAGSESVPFPFFVTTVTSVPSFALFSGIVISPVFGLICTSGVFTVHFPFGSLVPTAVFG